MEHSYHQRGALDKHVDLHVLIVPASLWREDLRFTYNTTCLESVSGGFVRVCPDTSLHSLRKEITEQLDIKLLPDSYVFLRNVGRHLTWVASRQEVSLKVELFVPPLAPCPEIYILDAKCLQGWESRAQVPMATATVQTHRQTTAGLANTFTSISSKQQQQQVKASPKHYGAASNITPPNQRFLKQLHNHSTQNPASTCTSVIRNTRGQAHRRSLGMLQSYPPAHWDGLSSTHEPASPGGYAQIHSHTHEPVSKSPMHRQDHSLEQAPAHGDGMLSLRRHGAVVAGRQRQQQAPQLHPLPLQQQTLHAPPDTHPQQQQAHMPQRTHPPPSHTCEDEASDNYDSRDDSSSGSDTSSHSPANTDSLEAARVPASQGKVHQRNYQPLGYQGYPPPRESTTSEASPRLAAQPQNVRQITGQFQLKDGGGSNSPSDSLSGRVVSDSHAPDTDSNEPHFQQPTQYPSSWHDTTTPTGQTLSTHVLKHSSNQQPSKWNSENTSIQSLPRNPTDLEMARDIRNSSLHRNGVDQSNRPQPHESTNPEEASSSTKTLNPQRLSRQRSQTYPMKSQRVLSRKGLEIAPRQPKATSSTPTGIQSRQLPLPPISDANSGNSVGKTPNRNSRERLPESHPLPPIEHQISSTQPQRQHTTGSDASSMQEVNQLLFQIRATKGECDQLGVARGELATHLRSLHLKLKEERQNADKEWRRKYFHEKKLTSSLEEQIKRKKMEIRRVRTQLNRRKEAKIQETNGSNPPHAEAPSELLHIPQSNRKIQCRRLEASTEELRRRLARAREKLTREQKTHKCLAAECKSLRQKLMAKKITCTRTRGYPVAQDRQ